MKRYFLYTFFATSILLLTACSGDNSPSSEPLKPTPTPVKPSTDDLVEISFNVSMPQVTTRASNTDDGKLIWTSGDAISVFDGEANREFKTTDSGEKAKFTGKVKKASTYYVIYPYQSNITMKDGVIHGLVFPSTQKAVANAIDNDLNVLTGSVKGDATEVVLSQAASFIKFRVSGQKAVDVSYVTLTTQDEALLSGQFDIGLTNSTPLIKPTSTSSTSIKLNAENGLKEDTDYYIATLPVSLPNGFELTFTDKNNNNWIEFFSDPLDIHNNEVNTIANDISLELMGNSNTITNTALIKAIENDCGKTFIKNEDGSVSITNIENGRIIHSLTQLDISYQELTDIDEIKYFTSLKSLDCSGNNLTKLDLSSLKYLEVLYCSHNQLSSINLKGCELLYKLDCSSNQLNTLDLSSFPSLKELYVNWNPPMSIDFSSCPSLVSLGCSDIQSTCLDLSKNNNLEALHLSAGNETSMNSINLSNCSKLKDLLINNVFPLTTLDVSECVSLETIEIHNTQIEKLNLSNCTKLNGVFCYQNYYIKELNLTNCDSLKMLYCSHNQIEKLDLSNKPLLWSLDCSENWLMELDLTDLESLKELNCSCNWLTELDISANTKITELKREKIMPQAYGGIWRNGDGFKLYINKDQKIVGEGNWETIIK